MSQFICGKTTTSGTNILPDPYVAIKMVRVTSTAEKIIFFEEDISTIDDGYSTLFAKANTTGTNLMSIIHDGKAKKTAEVITAAIPVPNESGRGNVLFCDGHVEFVPRTYAHAFPHLVPNADIAPWQALQSQAYYPN